MGPKCPWVLLFSPSQYPVHSMLSQSLHGISLLAIGAWIGMCPKRAQTDGIEVPIFHC